MPACWTFENCIYLPIQTTEEELQIEGAATGAKTNPGKSLNCFCSHLGFLSLASQMLLLSPADLHFGKEERTILRGYYIFSFQNVDLKCGVSVLSSIQREICLASLPVLGTTIYPSPPPSPKLNSQISLISPVSLPAALPKFPPPGFLHSPHDWLQAPGSLPIRSLLTARARWFQKQKEP